MAVEFVTRLPQTEYGTTYTVDSTTGAKTYGKTRTESYLVRMSSASDGAEAAKLADGIPQEGDADATNPFMVVASVDATEKDNDPRTFTVRPTYRVMGIDNQFDPTLDPPDENWTSESIREAIDTEPYGTEKRPIVNSADEDFDPPPERDFGVMVMTYSHNLPVYNTSVLGPLLYSTNNATFRGYPPGCALMAGISGQPRRKGSLAYWRVTYTIKFRYQLDKDGNQVGWKWRVVNRGYRKKLGYGLGYLNILDEHGMPVSKPQFLKADGDVLEPGGTPNILAFELFPRMNWAGLGIG
jgi:hypothetical protein